MAISLCVLVVAILMIGAACGVSPAPRVFSAVEGLETCSSCFYLEWQDAPGAGSDAGHAAHFRGHLR